MTASVGVGELTVLVPRDVDVTVRGSVGLGALRLFDSRVVDGSGVHRTVTVPALGPSRGTLDLSAEVGVGELEVRRAAA